MPTRFPLSPGSMIGVLGGGQLGRMLALAAARLGFDVTILDPQPDCPASRVAARTLEERLDDDLRRLIELAPTKEQDEHRVIPQIESSITYTEQEMAKVLERVETMLESTDKVFRGIGLLKQEAGLGRLKGQEKAIAELEATNQEMQNTVFALIQLMQFQDIARQKLERVMTHLKGMQVAISGKFRGQKEA